MKMIYSIIILVCCTMTSTAQFVQNNSRSLYSDVKAYRVGDAVTILIVEETIADNSATTTQSTKTDLSGGVSASTGSTSFDGSVSLGTGNTFNGRGQTSRNEKFRTKLSAKVTSVEANGNMKIEGKRTFQLNGENQSITLSGFIRPADVQSDNSIYSYSIMDLTVVYEGDGTITTAQEPGMITKFLRWLF
ncbi:MAG: flagellar basal body L-ring protein FlgH [Ignavibacteria bacterium]|nr:flagellar basal body L-ring protein FlgH [Ignavibacteria bacterium]